MDKDRAPNRHDLIIRGVTRRRLLQSGAAALAAPAILRSRSAMAADRVVKIGFVSPHPRPPAATESMSAAS